MLDFKLIFSKYTHVLAEDRQVVISPLPEPAGRSSAPEIQRTAKTDIENFPLMQNLLGAPNKFMESPPLSLKSMFTALTRIQGSLPGIPPFSWLSSPRGSHFLPEQRQTNDRGFSASRPSTQTSAPLPAAGLEQGWGYVTDKDNPGQVQEGTRPS